MFSLIGLISDFNGWTNSLPSGEVVGEELLTLPLRHAGFSLFLSRPLVICRFVHAIIFAISSRPVVTRVGLLASNECLFLMYERVHALETLNVERACLQTALCALQEKFRTTVSHFAAIVQVANRLRQGAFLLDVPTIVSEQYPKGVLLCPAGSSSLLFRVQKEVL